MRPGQVTVLAALPILALVGALRGTSADLAMTSPAGEGFGGLAPLVVTIITDGHPQVIRRDTPRAAPASVTTTRARTRPAARTAAHAATARVAANSPAPVAVPVPRSRYVSDSYPYASDATGGADPWGFTKRQCVSYVAWRLAERGRPLNNARDRWGSALGWDDTARRLGFAVTDAPVVGAVAQWDAHERSDYWSKEAKSPDGTFVAGPVGHVAWVTKVFSDGSVELAQYNGTGNRTFSTMRVRAPRYLRL